MITVRAATPTETAAIAAIAEQADLFPADALNGMIAPFFAGDGGELWLVALEGADVAGFAYCVPEQFTDGTYNLLAIATSTERKGLGVGTALIKALERELSGNGGRLLLVETSSQPAFERTQDFYRAVGFDHVATIPDYWTTGDAKVIFSKLLKGHLKI